MEPRTRATSRSGTLSAPFRRAVRLHRTERGGRFGGAVAEGNLGAGIRARGRTGGVETMIPALLAWAQSGREALSAPLKCRLPPIRIGGAMKVV
ncbi:hypothetical protein C4N9_16710 [Pararhodobacter marinus]|uniref:Uncharacterized protein n=1 Tax=Pararhodobacter marinus TaxID=2184063 RepID=A0A2U2C680_9RHOB|nr:hypothetical protein C4N9_16710 [Pararhodobacter marinus]